MQNNLLKLKKAKTSPDYKTKNHLLTAVAGATGLASVISYMQENSPLSKASLPTTSKKEAQKENQKQQMPKFFEELDGFCLWFEVSKQNVRLDNQKIKKGIKKLEKKRKGKTNCPLTSPTEGKIVASDWARRWINKVCESVPSPTLKWNDGEDSAENNELKRYTECLKYLQLLKK